jgi:hypothetical protein
MVDGELIFKVNLSFFNNNSKNHIMFSKDKIFVIGSKIINSCITPEQLDNAVRAIDLIRNLNNDETLISELIEIVEQRKLQIENFHNDVNNINVIYEKVTGQNKE